MLRSTEPDISFTLPGPPRGKGRPRSRIARSRAGQQFIAVYTDADTRSYENALRTVGAIAMKRAGLKEPFDCALCVKVVAVFPIPKSWSLKKQKAAKEGVVRPTTKPDWDNIAKLVDGVNGVVWRDDSQIVSGSVEKVYGASPELRVEVWRMSMMPLFDA